MAMRSTSTFAARAGDAIVMQFSETSSELVGFFAATLSGYPAFGGTRPFRSGDTSSKGTPMKSEARELLTEQLKDAYSAEKQALRCMQRAVRKASAEAL